MSELDDIAKETNISMCLSCGRCTPACPLSSYEKLSPRIFIEKYLTKDELDKLMIWECLTCSGCTVFCPSSVNFPEFMRALRTNYKSEAEEKCAHAGILHSIMRLMAHHDFKQDRLRWITRDLETSEDGDTLFFVGCSPYYDVYFDKWSPLEISRSAIKLMNHIDIKPVVLKNEVCCGHDLLWSGDEESFKKLVEKNKRSIEESGVKKIVFTCPEGYMTFKNYYNLDKKIEVKHITELLLENIDKIKFKETPQKVSYHDSCRLGRFMGVYDAPRKLLEAIPGLELNELPHSKSTSVCCGTSTWMCCDWKSKVSQLNILYGAKKISDKLVTSCPKCRIHYNCTMDEKEKNLIIEVEDIVITLANSIDSNSTSKPEKTREE